VANEVEICNAALDLIGCSPIENLTDPDSREAETCNKHYAIQRDATLREYNWGFARTKPIALTQLSETSDEYDYVYSYPLDCVEVREIFNPNKAHDDDLLPFARGISEDGSTLVIFTDEYQAKAICTRRVTNAALFDPLFADAFSLRLASKIAFPLKRDPELARSLFQQYQLYAGVAAAKSLNEQFKLPEPSNGYIDARQ